MRSGAWVFCLALTVPAACGSSTGPAGLPPSFVYLTSDRGDFIGAGQTYTYNKSNATLHVETSGGHLTIHVSGSNGYYWDGNFLAPSSLDSLRRGVYTQLGRFDSNTGGMEWGGQFRACNVLSGWFSVDGVDYAGGALAAINLRFEQHCEDSTAALHGTIHWWAADSTFAFF